MKIEKETLWQRMRFALVGGAATLTDLLVSWLSWKFLALHETAAAALGFAVAFWVSWFGHRFFTFRRTGSLWRFLALAASMLGLREAMIWGLTALGVRGFWAMFIPLAAVTMLTFVASKYAVFKGEPQGKQR